VLQGHPWIFPKAISSDTSKIENGELVNVLSAQNEELGRGVFNSLSLYRVRMLSYEPFNDLSDILSLRLKNALHLRRQLNLPNSQTNAYRLFNSEGDGLSGLTIDIYASLAVISSTAYWTELHRNVIEKEIRALNIVDELLWLSQTQSLKQDGYEESVDSKEKPTFKIEIKENGLKYFIDFSQSQKTGLFLDQRENHHIIKSISKNKRVLDLYCFTGGFSLAAADGGASLVTGIDSSDAAISQAKHNAELNSFSKIDFQKADARENLSKAADYDLVILDPPKVVPSRKHLARGEKYYQHLHHEVFQVMQKGALLLSCNCSAAMTQENFLKLINYCANKTRRQVRVLGTYGAGPDHPRLPHFPEGNYLHAVLLAVE
jgi:23S rRNA (cytosine1962-C5)-methyltransferase